MRDIMASKTRRVAINAVLIALHAIFIFVGPSNYIDLVSAFAMGMNFLAILLDIT